jgi:hypothetical protein
VAVKFILFLFLPLKSVVYSSYHEEVISGGISHCLKFVEKFALYVYPQGTHQAVSLTYPETQFDKSYVT